MISRTNLTTTDRISCATTMTLRKTPDGIAAGDAYASARDRRQIRDDVAGGDDREAQA